MRLHSLQRLLNPKQIAVVGGREAAAVVRQCKLIGFKGEIWPVNPKRTEVEGRVCYGSLSELPGVPDATFIAVPQEPTIEIVAELAQMGAGGAVCYASGFSEIGGAGQIHHERLQRAMGELAIVGPNCYGLLNYLDGVTLWPDEQGGKRVDKGVAIITQSGNISVSLSMQQRSVPVGYLISTGNQAGVTTADYIEGFLEDERVTAIGLHLEGLDDVERFSQVAIRALEKRVPIVILKTGASTLGSQVTMSHTRSLAGSDTLFDALFERLGILRVHSVPEFLETLKFLSIIGPLPGKKIASISCSGGEAAMVADRAAEHGLSMPSLIPEQEKNLYDALGERVALGNPLDYHTYIWGDKERQYRCFSAMSQGIQDVTLKILDYPRSDVCDLTDWVATGRAFRQAVVERQAKGAIVATMQENLPEAIGDELATHGVAPMWGLEECLLAIRGAAEIYQKQRQMGMVRSVRVMGTDAPFLEDSAGSTLDEMQSKALLSGYGLPVAKSVETTRPLAVQTAGQIGYPVVVKVLSDKIVHKSDVGGVHLNLQNSGEVAAAVAKMVALGERFLVEAMAPKPMVELILGISRDPQFGLVLVIGAGGVLVELLKDSVTLLFPIEKSDVEAALNSLKIAPLLNGYRGQAPADKGAIVDAVLSVARFAEEEAERLVEVDINPLFVYPESRGVLAVDAVVVERG